MVSPVQASLERNRRISNFKDRVASLRATSKVYQLSSDKSINTLDSSTLGSISTSCSSRSGNHWSHGPMGDIRFVKNANASPTSTAVVVGLEAEKKCVRKNPFVDDDDEDDDDDDDSSYVSSVDGNDSNTIASLSSSGLAKGESGRVNLAHLEKRDAVEEERTAESTLDSPRGKNGPLHCDESRNEVNSWAGCVGTSLPAAAVKKNPFDDSDDDDDDDDDDDEEEEEEEDTIPQSSTNVDGRKGIQMNYDASPNPFEDSSIDDDDDESFIGVLHANNVHQTNLKTKYSGSKSASSSNTVDSADGAISNASVGSSIDGALFNGFQELMTGAKRKDGDKKLEKTIGKSRETALEIAKKLVEQRRSPSRNNQVEKKNPFDDSSDVDEESQDQASKANDEERVEMNYDASPNPFEDSSIDADDDDDESFAEVGTASKAQLQGSKNDHRSNKSVSSSTTVDSVDANFSNASVGSSVDGALFNGFQELMSGGKRKSKDTTPQDDKDDSTNVTSQETTPVNNNAKHRKHKTGSSVSWNDKKSVASYSSSSFSGFSIETVDSNPEECHPVVVPPKKKAMNVISQEKSPKKSSQVKGDNTGEHAGEKDTSLLMPEALSSPASTDGLNTEGADSVNNVEAASNGSSPVAASNGKIDGNKQDVQKAQMKDENKLEVKPDSSKKKEDKKEKRKKSKAEKADKDSSQLMSTAVPTSAAVPPANMEVDTASTQVKATASTPVALIESGMIDASKGDLKQDKLTDGNHEDVKLENTKKIAKKSQNGKKGKTRKTDKEKTSLKSAAAPTPAKAAAAGKMNKGADANNFEIASTPVTSTAPTPVAASETKTIDASKQDDPQGQVKGGNDGEVKPELKKKTKVKGQKEKKSKSKKVGKESPLLISTTVPIPCPADAALETDKDTNANAFESASIVVKAAAPRPVAASPSGAIDAIKQDESKAQPKDGGRGELKPDNREKNTKKAEKGKKDKAEKVNKKSQQTVVVANDSSVDVHRHETTENVANGVQRAQHKDKREPQEKATTIRTKGSKQVEHGETSKMENTVDKELPESSRLADTFNNTAGKESYIESEEHTAVVKSGDASGKVWESKSSPRSELSMNTDSNKLYRTHDKLQNATLAKKATATKKRWEIGVDSLESSSTGFSVDEAFPTAIKKNESTSSNPFADILALRERERKANSAVVKKLMERNSGISEMNLESSSQETDSEASSTFKQDHKIVLENTEKIKSNPFNDVENVGEPAVDDTDIESDSSNEESSEESMSLEGGIFTDLQKALSKIQSVSYEATDEENDEESLDSKEHPEIFVPTGESCAVSSLKDADFKDAENRTGFDVNESFDSGEDICSVPKSPAPLENENDDDATSVSQSTMSSDQSENSDEETDEESEYLEGETVYDGENEKAFKVSDNTAESAQSSKGKEVQSAPSSDSVTAERSKVGDTNLSPPKSAVVLRDGSISTKDSIVGKTIRVTNSDMVAERIYLESLRAQVHAELKVHVADEEIRLALEARLQAIRDFYKKKATVSKLKSSHDDDFLEKVASLPSQQKCSPSSSKPKILRSESVDKSTQAPLSPVSSVSYPNGVTMRRNEDTTAATQNAKLVQPSSSTTSPSTSHQKGVTMNSSTKHTQKLVFERAQANIDEAIKAANISLAQQSDLDECKGNDDESEEEEFVNRIHTQSAIPSDIFTQDTFWDEDEAIIPPSPSAKTQIGITSPTVRNAWNFYREVNNLMSDSRVYDYEFKVIQEDPLYPYLNSLVGIADSGDDGKTMADKEVQQEARQEYKNKSPHRVCHMLAKEAKIVLPELIELCVDIGRKLDMKTMAVGPVKTASAALIKCEKKYGGNPLLVTDFCRVSLFVPDIASLLALIEIILSKYAYLVKRIKLSNLKNDHSPIIGGYRDCKINVDVDGHICEIQVHLEALWNIKEESGYIHYKRCFENNVDKATFDISRTLTGLDREFLSDLIKVGEDAVESIPITSLKHDNENQIRDYSALASLYLYYGLPVRAEYTLRQIVKLRTESINFGPGHAETLMHLKLLRKSLKMQHKYKSASAVTKRITRAEKGKDGEDDLVELCTQHQCGAMDNLCDSILDPSKKEREEEKKKAQSVEDSRAIWLGVRKTFFKQ
eukprot:CCRYP_000845-RA/>CCRYP_000845-RA protein AED:0.25 eAED:0.25 QI:187/1/1/1/1/1/4/120/2119